MPFMLSVTNKLFILSVAMLNVVILSFILLSAVAPISQLKNPCEKSHLKLLIVHGRQAEQTHDRQTVIPHLC